MDNKKVAENESQIWHEVDRWKTESGPEAVVLRCEWKHDTDAMTQAYFTGYAKLPEPLELDDLELHEIDVHGGVTFKGEGRTGPQEADGSWIGFDLNHLTDDAISTDLEYAKKECEKMARQLIQTEDYE